MRTRLGAYRLLIDTIGEVRPNLEIGLCLENPRMFDLLHVQDSVGRSNCVL
jgi:hypothetical protein